MTADGKTSRIREFLKALPDEPGIYIFRDAAGKVLYVGKAKSLRKRVTSYFRNSGPADGNIRIARMLKLVHDLEFMVTGTETEALLLESNFIKHHRPPFNVSLRDDKSYPYVVVTLDEEFPRVVLARGARRRGTACFGPFTNVRKVRDILDLLGKIFPFRKCRGRSPGRRSGSPCLNYQIERCLAPCTGEVDADAYREMIGKVVKLLSGDAGTLAAELRREMEAAAAGQDFERAALFRDRLQALEHLLEKQQATGAGPDSMDVIGVCRAGDTANIQVLQVRDGLLSDRHSFFLTHVEGESETSIVEQFLIGYYSDATGYPASIVLPEGFRRPDVIGGYLSKRKGSRVEAAVGRRGRRRKLAAMAAENARLALEHDRLRREQERQRPARALEELRRFLGLAETPLRIECYDISNTGGEDAVGSMVVFEGGSPYPAHYRRFIVRAVRGPDDFAMMAEVLSRRFGRHETRRGLFDAAFATLPDLVVVDGGAGQVAAAKGALAAAGKGSVPVIGLAKRHEEIYRPREPRPLRLPADSEALKLLRHVRDEAHRFAVDHHRRRRGRAVSSSILDEVPGIGPVRKRAILDHFGSPERFLAASRDELEAVPGLPAKVARDAYAYLHRFRGEGGDDAAGD